MKLIKLPLFICFFLLPFCVRAQYELGVSTGISKIIDGSYNSFYYENFFRIYRQQVVFEPVFSFMSSSNFDKGNEYNWHNLSYLSTGVNILLVPFNKEGFSFKYGVGVSLRLKNETIPVYWKYLINDNGEEELVDIIYNNQKGINLGSNIKFSLEYQLSKNVVSGIGFNLVTYTKGVSCFVLAFNIGYKL